MDTISLIIFFICIFLFFIEKLPQASIAILGCALMVLFGVCDFSVAFGSFASSTIVLMIGIMIIGAAISETGLSNIIGDFVLKISGNSETKLIVFSYLLSAVMSAFLTNSAVLAIFIPIIYAAAQKSSSISVKRTIMPITLGCILGGASTLSGSTQQLVTQGLLESNGLTLLKMFDLTPVGLTLIVFGLIYCLTLGRRISQKVWKCDDDFDYKDEVHYKTPNKKKIIIVSVIFGITVVLYITNVIPLALTSTLSAIACIFTGCIQQNKAIKAVNWDIIGRYGGFLGMAKGLEVSGGSKLLSDGISLLLGDSVQPVLILLLVIIVTKVISEFMSPSAALLITLPFVFSIANIEGLNTYAYAIAATFASSTALCTPLASTTLGMSMSVGYSFKDYGRYYVWFDIVTTFIIMGIVMALYPLKLV